MPQGQESGTSARSPLETAASAFEPFFSDMEDTEGAEQPQDEAEEAEPASEDEEATEQSESEEAPESDEEPSEEESTEDAEPEDEPAPEPRKLKVKIDGQESEVTEDEAAKGYMRNQDYTRKTQELANARKKLESEELPAIRNERAQLATQLGQLSEALKAITPTEPDWDELRKGDPAEFAAAWASWQQHQNQIKAVELAHKNALDKVANDQRSHLMQHLQAENERLLEAVPAWKDDAVAKKEKAEIFKFAQGEGFTPEELKEVYDHRVLKALRKAWLYDKAQTALPAAKKKIQQVRAATPGPKGSTKPKATELQKRQQRLAKSGKQEDAAAAFELLLGDELI